MRSVASLSGYIGASCTVAFMFDRKSVPHQILHFIEMHKVVSWPNRLADADSYHLPVVSP
jgi:hypothetical protein